MRSILVLLACVPLAFAGLRIPHGAEPGTIVDASGFWEFQPGFENRYYRVPVPQMLTRVQWWLDDSEDFKRFESARLKRLGLDTERVEDGAYRLVFEAPALPRGTRLWVEFDGVAMKSRTSINGVALGEHTGMFSRFSYDLTPHLKPGSNELSVFVSMEKMTASSRPMSEAVTVNLTAAKVMTLSKGMFGPLSPNRPNREYDQLGIWQPVRFVLRGESKIDDAWFIPSLSGAELRVESRAPAGCVLRARWYDKATGKALAAAGPSPVLPDGRTALKIENIAPKLWTPDVPNLYRMEVRLEDRRGRLLDRVERNVGFRTFEIRGNQFYLNGRKYWLRGGNQLPYGKNPWDAALPRKLIRLLHDNNIRVTRTHATPWNEAWLDAADEIGLGVSIEGIRPWALAGLIGAPPRELHEHWLTENADVVRRIRNHPSVLIWTVGNEMLLRDAKNLDKWKMLSEVVQQTRKLDPYRPVICSSEYSRDPEFYESVLKPAGIDDGDIDDIHRYRGWYTESPFVTASKFETEMKRNRKLRPFIGQEMSSGYPDLDTGLPVLRYTRDLVTPQAWVGEDSFPGKDPAIFLEHNRAVTKRWAEQLRYEREDKTAGFLLFSAECWFRHSYDSETVSPYPVVEALRDAFAPVGLALETGRRRFFAGETVETAAFITNDDEAGRDFKDLRLTFSVGSAKVSVDVPRLAYYETIRVPLKLTVPPAGSSRGKLQSVLTLASTSAEISRSVEPVEVVSSEARPDMSRFVTDAAELEPGTPLRGQVEAGATAILLRPGKRIVELFPDDVQEVRPVLGEYADWAPIAGTPLASGLERADIKWWARSNDWRVFVTESAHRLRPGGKARELIRFIPAHSYIPPERVAEQYMTVLFEIPLGRGRIWVCDLDLEASAAVDPAARRLANNLLKAAADPDSTTRIIKVPKLGTN